MKLNKDKIHKQLVNNNKIDKIIAVDDNKLIIYSNVDLSHYDNVIVYKNKTDHKYICIIQSY